MLLIYLHSVLFVFSENPVYVVIDRKSNIIISLFLQIFVYIKKCKNNFFSLANFILLLIITFYINHTQAAEIFFTG